MAHTQKHTRNNAKHVELQDETYKVHKYKGLLPVKIITGPWQTGYNFL